MDAHRFVIKTDASVGEFYNFWHVANWNKPFRLLQQHHINRLKGYAPYCDAVNCVYLLGGRQKEHNCWYQGLDADGNIIADFTGMIDQLQAAYDNGYTPWVVLDNVPYPMSDPPGENFYGNTEPPADEKVWRAYVHAAVKAMIQAFGYETVSRWWFRVGTEPDLLPGHWSGTKQQYFDHYDYTVDAVTSLIPEALIGPGNILNPVEGEYGIHVRDQWGLEIIDHCAAGRNAVTGETGTAMRWFSCSWYGRVSVPLSMYDKAMRNIRDRLEKYPLFVGLPVKVGEFTVLHDETGTRLYSGDTTEWSASFYAGIADRSYAHDISHVYEWHHATQRVLHPKGQVIKMLGRMAGGERLAIDPPMRSEEEFGVLAARRKGFVYLLIYNHDKDRDTQADRRFDLELRGLEDGDYLLDAWTVDRENGVWAYEYQADCKAAGLEPKEGSGRYEGGIEFIYPDGGFEVFEANREKYEALCVLAKTTVESPLTCEKGQIALSVELPCHSVRLLKLTRKL